MPNSIPSAKPSEGKLAKHAPISERPTKRRRVSPEPEPERELVSQRREPDLESESDESNDSERPDSNDEAASSDIDSSEPEEAEQAIPDDHSLASSFEELGITESLCDACKSLGYTTPTPIQSKAIPIALQGRDVIGVAETGSGKTAAFALPILQTLLDNPRPFFGLVLAPTRDLAIQIGKAFEALGSIINARAAVIVGGVNMVEQMRMLAKKPHVIVATPGRLLDHLEKSKGFSLHALKYLVMDEADKLLDLDFGPAIEKICKKLPRDRNTYLFSATMSTKVERLQRANLRDPIRVSVSKDNHQTASNLKQLLWVIPQMHKDLCLVYLMHNFAGKSVIVFVRTYRECQRLAIFLRQLGFAAVPLYGKLPMSARISVLNKFRAKSRDILVATDVAARGLDIPNVDLVVNFDLPQDDKTYVHRVGRTARAGKSGTAINMCTQYGIEVFLRIEHFLRIKMDVYEEYDHELLKPIEARVEEAQRTAKLEMKDLDRKQKERDKKRKKGAGFAGGNDEDEG